MKTLFISDLDGTLLSDNALPTAFTAKTVNTLIEKGMNFSVATSRSIHDATEILEKFNFKTPVITMNGTFISDLSGTPKALYYNKIPNEYLETLTEIFIKHNCPPNVYTFADEKLSIEFVEMKHDMQKRFFKAREFSYNGFKKVDKYNLSGEVVFISIIGYEENIKAAEREIKERVPEVNCVSYKDNYEKHGWFLEVSHSLSNKADALKKLKEMGGFERVVAFGDNINDLPLFSVADVKIAVENAKQEVKEMSDLVIGKNTDDAVAKYLLNYFSGE